MKLNSKKVLKIVAVILLVMLAFTIIQPVFAAEINTGNLKADMSADSTSLTEKAQKIMGLIRNVSVVVSVIMLMIIGVKFMLGSAEEKAEYKKSLMPLVIGIIIVMMATTLVSFVWNFAK